MYLKAGGDDKNEKIISNMGQDMPGCNIGRKYPHSFIGRRVRNHCEKGCPSHDAYVEVYGGDEPTSKKNKEESNEN